jgi:hypothetical protein
VDLIDLFAAKHRRNDKSRYIKELRNLYTKNT